MYPTYERVIVVMIAVWPDMSFAYYFSGSIF